jgi:hypothetical protein
MSDARFGMIMGGIAFLVFKDAIPAKYGYLIPTLSIVFGIMAQQLVPK